MRNSINSCAIKTDNFSIMLAIKLNKEVDYDLGKSDTFGLGTSGSDKTKIAHNQESNSAQIDASDEDIEALELNASGVRRILQEIFPLRRLVLSQFTLYNQLGITIPSGKTYSRGRRCYKVRDLLAVALILALKEQGIPNKNLENLPSLIHSEVDNIFSLGRGSIVSGFDNALSLRLLGSQTNDGALSEMLDFDKNKYHAVNPTLAPSYPIYWAYDVGYLSEDLIKVSKTLYSTLINLDSKESETKQNTVNLKVVR